MHHTVEIEELSFSYPDGHPALSDVSLHIGPDEKVALVGPNGAGKSTPMFDLIVMKSSDCQESRTDKSMGGASFPESLRPAIQSQSFR